MEAERTYERLTHGDLQQIAGLATRTLLDVFTRTRVASRYRERLLLLCLCQGAALHFVDGRNGVKDLDIWAFFEDGLDQPFPPRAVWKADFGPSHLGRHPADKGFSGRRLDIIGRSIRRLPDQEPKNAVRRWLQKPGGSAAYLAKRPVIGLAPIECLGEVIWPGEQT